MKWLLIRGVPAWMPAWVLTLGLLPTFHSEAAGSWSNVLSADSRPTATPSPTRTPHPTATLPIIETGIFHLFLNTDFRSGAAGPWPISTVGASTAKISNGRYVVSVAEGGLSVRGAKGMPAQAMGQISGSFQVSGRGQVGLAANFNRSANGTRTMYACWITNTRTAGCTRWVNNMPIDLPSYPSLDIVPHGDNTLVMRLQGNLLITWINGGYAHVYTVQSRLRAGAWGPYVVSAPGQGTVSGRYSWIALAR